MTDRELSVVVLGATGVTGRRVAGYLAERAREDGFAWAAAARDPAKLDRLMDGVGAGGCPAIAADTGDERSLRALAARTRAVVNLVGRIRATPVQSSRRASKTEPTTST